MIFSPALNSKVQAKTIVQTIKDSKGNEDAKKLSSKLQYLFNNLRRVEYKDKIKESDGAKKLLKWLEQYFVNNKLEIENYINSNKEFSKEIATLYRSCLNKRKSIYSKYASKFNMEIPTDIVAKPIADKVNKEVSLVKPIANEVKKEAVQVKPVVDKVEKKVIEVKPVANEVKEKVVEVKSVASEVEKKVVEVKPITNNDKKQTSKNLNKLTSKAKLPKTGSNVGGIALGIIGAITTMFGIVVSKINRK